MANIRAALLLCIALIALQGMQLSYPYLRAPGTKLMYALPACHVADGLFQCKSTIRNR